MSEEKFLVLNRLSYRPSDASALRVSGMNYRAFITCMFNKWPLQGQEKVAKIEGFYTKQYHLLH